MKKLLIEHTSSITIPKVEIMESIKKNDGKLIIKNVLLQKADTPNRNRRVYPKSVLDKALNEYSNKIANKTGFGELDHPINDDANTVSLKYTCQAIADAYWIGNELRGDVEILDTRCGRDVKAILLAGYRVGQSSRGLGSTTPFEGGEELLETVSDDFELITLADSVSDPSTINADMIYTESRKISNKKIFIPSSIDQLFDNILKKGY